MSRYARKAGRKKHPNRHCCKMVAVPTPPVPADKTLVYAASRIDGETKVIISPEILKETEGMPWHARCARISALTGIPFVEVNEYVKQS
jgi:hypothetical protein